MDLILIIPTNHVFIIMSGACLHNKKFLQFNEDNPSTDESDEDESLPLTPGIITPYHTSKQRFWTSPRPRFTPEARKEALEMAQNGVLAELWQALMNLGVKDPSTTPIGNGSLLSDGQITSNEVVGFEFVDSLTTTCSPCNSHSEISI